MTHSIDRRTLLLGTVAAGTTAAAGLHGGAALAKAPFAKTQVPYFYRFPVGKFQATIVSDGPLPLGEPSATFKGITKEDVAKALTENFLPADNVVLEQNALVLNTGSRLVLFDSGMGTSKAFGSTTGRLLASLRQAGINPDQIDDVICTHAHIDHVGGLASATGKRYFRNATVHLSKADYDFWTDEKKLTGDLKLFITHARLNLLPYKNRLKFIEDGKDVIPGIQAMAAPGHTVGHTIFVIKSESAAFVFIGDTTHHQILLTERPRTEFAYDTDPKQAVQSRLKVFDMLAKDKLPFVAYHFPWPGVGHLAKQGDGYRFFASPMEIVPIPPKKKA
ncbi:MAG: MBL fold metallo-hydrolase [Hyphomicrobiaceae bacterium]|nr:MAG: MBL fold metallo-hydrolase [Hyphomicrobiaceae bacterium]